MKLIRTGPAGRETPAVLLDEGRAVAVGELLDDYTPRWLAEDGLQRLAEELPGRLDRLPSFDPSTTRLGPPLARPGKIVCVGLNYREHAKEAGAEIPAEPILFMKAPDTVVGPDDVVLIPPGSEATDYEVELAVVIGRTARYLADDADPLAHVAGYAISDDVSERVFQMERGGQWDKGKNCETFNPLGPWLVTADEVPEPQALDLRLAVNGEVRQDSSTSDMIFPVAELVRYISQFMPLYPGDIINTGTPQGVGAGFDPPRFVRPGDEVTVAISGLGAQRGRFERALVEGDER
ncbi:2-hydroxyhepta-2,4-diene-1,7-dioate isomerase [Streptomyces sp. 3MP-14]|uniref:2-hydroxyhepta-2,4-diene-1,7-dioate isomerase n=1 Tax=Streptomyces mimosae TaxID=2586635 RepID=A0A5N6ASR4_9ACTN|nr:MULTISPECIES: fumarylacetoacetate hydrolase family protein [Streptomyces]KAB8170960.1 2-hydroxyhepta-2,4-diene-1,7-dioate isomerase [Streptomyces mimosae]KAB8179689.1 2-hydroxyhepta-2,4-diene-1,7-dioate isomerase [Streptomyces sp. 3MP-14]